MTEKEKDLLDYLDKRIQQESDTIRSERNSGFYERANSHDYARQAFLEVRIVLLKMGLGDGPI